MAELVAKSSAGRCVLLVMHTDRDPHEGGFEDVMYHPIAVWLKRSFLWSLAPSCTCSPSALSLFRNAHWNREEVHRGEGLRVHHT
jgi:hypothetical protein